MLGNFACFFCGLRIFFLINFFKNIFQEYHQIVKQFGSRSGPTFCLAWSGSKLFAGVISRWQKFATSRERVKQNNHNGYYFTGKVRSSFFNMCKIGRVKSSCTCTKYHPGLCSPFIHSVISNDSVKGQWLGLDQTALMQRLIRALAKDMFLHGTAHVPHRWYIAPEGMWYFTIFLHINMNGTSTNSHLPTFSISQSTILLYI